MIWKNRFGGLAPSPDDVEREVDEEVRSHLALKAEDLERQGVDPKTARLTAQRRFGDVNR